MRFLLLILLLAPQDGARELVEKLRSESVVERQDAARKLKELGEAARPVLEQAANDSDGEVAVRARHLLRLLNVRARLTPAFRKAFPEAEEEFSVDPDVASLKFLRAAVGQDPALPRSDLDPMAAGALRACRTAEERQEVLQIVSSHQLRGGSPAILPLLEDTDSDVRELAFGIAVQFGLRVAPATLEAFLQQDYPRELRRKAAQALLELRLPDALPRFTKLLQDTDLEVRQTAVEALADLGARDVVPDLLRSAGQDRPFRNVALTALHGFDARDRVEFILPDLDELTAYSSLLPLLEDWRPTEAVGALTRSLHGKEATRVAGAADLLGAMRAKTSIPELLPLLERDERMVVHAALEAVLLLDAREAIPTAVRMTGSTNHLHREAGARLLRALGARTAASEVRAHLRSGEAEVRKVAARLIVEWQASEQSEEIARDLERMEPGIARESLEVLGRLRARSAVPLLQRLSSTPGFESGAMDALARMGAPEAAAPLLARLRSSSDPIDRLRALRGLGWLRLTSTAEEVDRLLGDPDPDLRIAALRTLLEIDRARGLTRTVERLKDNDWRVREASLLLLSRDRQPGTESAILALLEDPEERVRPAAIQAAGAAGASEAVSSLRKALGSIREEDVFAALEACERIRAKEALPDIEALYQRTVGDPDPAQDRLAARAVWAYARVSGDLFRNGLMAGAAESQRAAFGAVGSLRARNSEAFLLREFPVPGRGPSNDVAARALAALGSKDGLSRLVEEIERGVPGSGRLLREFDARDRAPALAALLRHRSAAVRRESLDALAALGARDSWHEFVPLLRDRHPDVRKAAASGLGLLAVPESAADLLAVPPEGSSVAAHEAALALCRMGRKERAAMLLPESPFELNALREPEVWKRLQATPLREDLSGAPLDLLRSALAQAGLALEVDESVESDGARIRWVWSRNGRTSLLDAIEELLQALPPFRRPRILLAKEKARLMNPDAASGDWKAWWAEASK